MKTLITGAGGQVGRALAALAPVSFEVVATARGDLDLADAGATAEFVAAHEPDLIINAAAYTAVDRAESEPELAHEINAAAADRLAAAAAAQGARMIHLSTDFVFDGSHSTPYAPDAATAPLSVYGQTKLEGERAVRTRLPEASVILRTAWVYAAVGHNFLLTMLRLMGEGRPLRVVADQIGTPTSAASIAETVWALAAQTDLEGTYHWTDAGVASWYDFAMAISEEAVACGLLSAPASVTPITTEEYPTAAHRPAFSVLDTRSTCAATGLAPAHWRVRLRQVLQEIARG
ncbi:MAG TPA: dTDP-4-dehydrorhamnose reductase [Gammaproteobacteria bacterium]|jgi:dTDP-4-dehydrorhamnose reductase